MPYVHAGTYTAGIKPAYIVTAVLMMFKNGIPFEISSDYHNNFKIDKFFAIRKSTKYIMHCYAEAAAFVSTSIIEMKYVVWFG